MFVFDPSGPPYKVDLFIIFNIEKTKDKVSTDWSYFLSPILLDNKRRFPFNIVNNDVHNSMCIIYGQNL